MSRKTTKKRIWSIKGWGRYTRSSKLDKHAWSSDLSSIMEFPFAYTRSSKLDKSSVEITMSSADKSNTLALARQVKAWLDDMIQIQSSVKGHVKCNTLSSLTTHTVKFAWTSNLMKLTCQVYLIGLKMCKLATFFGDLNLWKFRTELCI